MNTNYFQTGIFKPDLIKVKSFDKLITIIYTLL